MHTSVDGVFACGNVVHVHDLVDFVTLESRRAAAGAARWLARRRRGPAISLMAGENVSYVVPQRISLPVEEDVTLLLRVRKPLHKPEFILRSGGEQILRRVRPLALPAEMVEITVPAASISGSGDLEILCRGEER